MARDLANRVVGCWGGGGGRGEEGFFSAISIHCCLVKVETLIQKTPLASF